MRHRIDLDEVDERLLAALAAANFRTPDFQILFLVKDALSKVDAPPAPEEIKAAATVDEETARRLGGEGLRRLQKKTCLNPVCSSRSVCKALCRRHYHMIFHLIDYGWVSREWAVLNGRMVDPNVVIDLSKPPPPEPTIPPRKMVLRDKAWFLMRTPPIEVKKEKEVTS